MTEFNKWLAVIEAVVKILKVRFPNLTAEETIKIANSIVATTRIELEKSNES